MKHLSEFKGAEGVAVVGKLIVPIVSAAKKAGAKHPNEADIAYISRMLTDAPEEFLQIEAILNCIDPNDEEAFSAYNPSAIETAQNMVDLLNDKELLSLFTGGKKNQN